MSDRDLPKAISDRELDRLLALMPPPPAAATDLADRIAARAAATPQVPPLPPRRAARTGRRLVRRRTWAGAVIGSFLLAVAATAAVLGGHIDFKQLANLPALSFHRHANHAPARLATAPAPMRRAPAVVPTGPAAPAVMADPVAAGPGPARPAAAIGAGGERLRREGLVDHPLPHRALAAPEHVAVGARPLGREVLQRLVAPDRRAAREHADVARERRLAAVAPARLGTPPAEPRDNDAAEANREALRATERSLEAQHQLAGAGSRTERGEAGANDRPGQRWRGQGWGGWRGQGQGRFAGWRQGSGAGWNAPAAGEPKPGAAPAQAVPEKGGAHSGPRRGGRLGRRRRLRR